ncbi:MAG: monovalent cation/H(+) antiporter subunit G [Natronospirillum sp.]
MSDVLHWVSGLFFVAGGFFFVAGTLGLLRFPDVFSRLHAVTKADTLGFGLVVIGLSLRADSLQAVVIMLLVWVLVLVSGATAGQLLARYAREDDGTLKEDVDGAD